MKKNILDNSEFFHSLGLALDGNRGGGKLTLDSIFLNKLSLPALDYFKLSETAGTTAVNYVAGRSNGTYVGSPTLGSVGDIYGETNGGNAVTLNGTTQYVDLGNSSKQWAGLISTGLTLLINMKEVSVSGNNRAVFGVADSSGKGFAAYVWGAGSTFNVFFTMTSATGVTYTSKTLFFNVSPGTEYQNQSMWWEIYYKAPGTITLYCDGVKYTGSFDATPRPDLTGTFSATTNNVFAGAVNGNGTAVAGSFFGGPIQRIVAFNGALTEADRLMYMRKATRTDETGMLYRVVSIHSPKDSRGLKQLANNTGAVVASDDPVGYIPDETGNGCDAIQTITSTIRAADKRGRYCINSDGSKEVDLDNTMADLGQSYTLTAAPLTGATTATLVSGFGLATGTYTVMFANGETRTVALTNGSTAIPNTGSFAALTTDCVGPNGAIAAFLVGDGSASYIRRQGYQWAGGPRISSHWCTLAARTRPSVSNINVTSLSTLIQLKGSNGFDTIGDGGLGLTINGTTAGGVPYRWTALAANIAKIDPVTPFPCARMSPGLSISAVTRDFYNNQANDYTTTNAGVANLFSNGTYGSSAVGLVTGNYQFAYNQGGRIGGDISYRNDVWAGRIQQIVICNAPMPQTALNQWYNAILAAESLTNHALKHVLLCGDSITSMFASTRDRGWQTYLPKTFSYNNASTSGDTIANDITALTTAGADWLDLLASKRVAIFALGTNDNGHQRTIVDMIADYATWRSTVLGYDPGAKIIALDLPVSNGFCLMSFTGALANGATTGTLSQAWPFATGSYLMTFDQGNVRTVTLTNGSTNPGTFTALVGATSTGLVALTNTDGSQTTIGWKYFIANTAVADQKVLTTGITLEDGTHPNQSGMETLGGRVLTALSLV